MARTRKLAPGIDGGSDPNGGRLWAHLALVFLLCACADLTGSATDGAVEDGDESCSEGQSRCQGQSYQLCSAGRFVESFRCDSAKVCVPDLGCRDCDPGLGQGCHDNNVHVCDAHGSIGAELERCYGLSCAAGACREWGCAVGARLVYVVDAEHRLLSFDPSAEANHFKLIANLSCPGAGAETPFSMSVDRGARAWVLYTSGDLYWVSTETGACSTTPYQTGQQGYQLFGMGFVSDQPGSSAEKLYVAGTSRSVGGNDKLGYIDPATMQITVVGPTATAEYSPELTGTGDAELYAYHPGTFESFVARIDKQNAQVLQKWSVPPLTGEVSAWAFAHWGGKFYIFVTDRSLTGSETSKVLLLDPVSGKAQTFLASIPYKIVGAGVSTCAPVID